MSHFSDLIQLGVTALLAFYVAWNLGANDVANSMGTSVGSGTLSLKQALLVAGILEFMGAVLFGHHVSETLATEVINPTRLASPQVFLIGMISVLISCGIWLQVATCRGLPVASSHAVVGAIAGFSWVAAGTGAVDWSTLGLISVTWLITPLISGVLAGGFYRLLQRWILNHPQPLQQLQEWIPWLSAGLFTVFGVVVLVPLFGTDWVTAQEQRFGVDLPTHDWVLITGGLATLILTGVSWRRLAAGQHAPDVDGKTLMEQQFGRFQVLSACFVAFAHGSNDVGNAIAPLAAINYVQTTGIIPLEGLLIPLWVLALGGLGLVAGLAVWGKNVIQTIGQEIISLQPSSGFCAELATATTVLMASRLGLPVSTSHALVGGVVGIGLMQSWQSVRLETVRSIGLAWLITVPVAGSLAAGIFTLLSRTL